MKPWICYLCGGLIATNGTRDHVPPRMFFGRSLRMTARLQLTTLPTHKVCNRSYQEDEEYFVHSFCWFGKDTAAGRAVIDDVVAARRKPEKVGLRMKIRGEWDEHPSGLWLPSRRVLKRFDPRRVDRVVWKIVRGLHFLKYGEVLALRAPRTLRLIVGPDGRPTTEELALTAAEPEGRYPGVFDFKHRVHVIDEARGFYAWALLFWDCMMAMAFVRKGGHDPTSST